MAPNPPPNPTADATTSARTATCSMQEHKARKLQIRREYEITPVSVRGLARRHGVSSENTIRRWKNAEGWKKDIKAVAANLANQSLALVDDPRQQPTLTAGGALRSDHAPKLGKPLELPIIPSCARVLAVESAEKAFLPPKVAENVRTAHTVHISAHGEGDVEHGLPGLSVPHKNVAQPRSSKDNRDLQSSSTGQESARTHAQAALNQAIIGEKIIGLSDHLIKLIMLAVTVLPDDAPDELVKKQHAAVQQLMSIGSGKQTLSSLLKMAGDFMQQGVAIQRRALSMDKRTNGKQKPMPRLDRLKGLANSSQHP